MNDELTQRLLRRVAALERRLGIQETIEVGAAHSHSASDIATIIDGATEATTVADANKFALIVAGALRWINWTNLKAAIKTYADGLYLIVAGVAGGQTAYGGTGSGDDLILEGTSHATKGDVRLNPSGGNVSVNGVPVRQLTVVQKTGTNKGILITGKEQFQEANGSDTTGVWLGAGVNRSGNRQAWIGDYDNLASATNGFFRLYSGTGVVKMGGIRGDGAAELPLIINENALPVGIGAVTSPQGILHVHDGTSGWLKKSFTSQTFSSRVAVIPNGTGDMLYACGGTAVVRASDGTVFSTAVNFSPGGSQIIYTAGGGANVLLLEGLDTAGANNGAISIRRSAGSLSYIVSLDIHWL